MADSDIPQPGPAKLKRNAGPDEWLEAAKNCKYLSEQHMKQLCEIVKEFMMEGKPPLPLCSKARSPDLISVCSQNPTYNLYLPRSRFAEISTASFTMYLSFSGFLVECLTKRTPNHTKHSLL